MPEARKPSDSYRGLNKDSDSYSQISKWQKASVDITNLKFKLGNILDGFTPEEKDSKKYEQLLETVEVLFDHIMGSYKEKKDELDREEIKKELEIEIQKELAHKNGVFSPKTAVIFVCSGIVYKIFEKFIIYLLTL